MVEKGKYQTDFTILNRGELQTVCTVLQEYGKGSANHVYQILSEREKAIRKIRLNVVGFFRGEYDGLMHELRNVTELLSKELFGLYQQISRKLQDTVPKHLSSQIAQRADCLCINTMWYIIEELKCRAIMKMPTRIDTSSEGIFLIYDS
jgi:hypothetical protein